MILCILLLGGLNQLTGPNKDAAAIARSSEYGTPSSAQLNEIIITPVSSPDDSIETLYIEEEKEDKDESEKVSFKKFLVSNDFDSPLVCARIRDNFICLVAPLSSTDRFAHFSSLRSLNIEFSVFQI